MDLKSKGIFEPEEGWQPHTWYLGKCRMNSHNPTFEVFIYSGFLYKGQPQSYSGVMPTNVCPKPYTDSSGWEIKDCFYLKPEK